MPFEPFFGTELLFTILATIFCFLIHAKTKESYKLTKYQGLRYFRDAFLCLGISYIFRFFLAITMFSLFAFDVFLPPKFVFPIFILPLSYLSMMGLSYLALSTLWKHVNTRAWIIGSNILAIALALGAVFLHTHILVLAVQAALLIITVISYYAIKGKHVTKTKILYLLTCLLWLLNLVTLDPRLHNVGMLIEAAAIIVFFVIYHKLSKWAK